MTNTDGEHHGSSFTQKLKNPFHELKEKLDSTHLHNVKVHLNHKKYAPHSHCC